MRLLNTFEIKNGEELTQRIQTVEAYHQLVEKKNGLERDVDALEKSKSKAERELEKILDLAD